MKRIQLKINGRNPVELHGITLAGKTISIEVDDAIAIECHNLGQFSTFNNEIKLYSGATMDILLHEIIEAVLYLYNGRGDIPHEVINAASAGIADVLNQWGISLQFEDSSLRFP